MKDHYIYFTWFAGYAAGMIGLATGHLFVCVTGCAMMLLALGLVLRG